MAKVESIEKQVHKYLISKLPLISDEVILSAIRGPIKSHLINSPEYISMTSENGGLRGMFGFEKGTEIPYVNAVIDRIVQEMTVKITKKEIKKTNLVLHFDTKVIDYTSTTIFSMDEANIDTGKSNSGQDSIELPWVRWLLQRGNSIIVQGFHVEFISSDALGYSRSGAALMFKNGFWAVPNKHSGTEDYNWLNRALSEPGDNTKPRGTLTAAFEKGIIDAVQGIINA